MDVPKMLRERGLKVTPCREEMLGVISQSDSPLTAEDIYAKIKRGNLSTVYRGLTAMADKGVIKRVQYGTDNKYRYTSVETHKHYFHCQGCNSTIALDECPLGDFEQRLERELGVKISEHKLNLTGLCSNCNKNGVGK